jgi:serine/threonine protein kinase
MDTQKTLPTVVSMQHTQADMENLLPIGSKFEKYHVEKLLAKGGMGAVYLVRHEVLDTRFALKVLFPHVAAQNTDFVERFIREAKLSSTIRHPNLIIVHDAGCNAETGLYYLVMDYVPNGTLRDKLAVSGRILPCGVLTIIRQIAEALRVAHNCGTIHRDIKPENIMFDEDGNARLADLGIAKSINGDTMLTMAAAVMGTPSYMSPEQAKDSGKIDERADVYSLGVVLYEMLAGHCPFSGNTPLEILSKVISDEKAPNIEDKCPDLPLGMASLVHDMIEKDLDRRIATIDILLSRIAAIEGDSAAPNDLQVTIVSGVGTEPANAVGASHRRMLRSLIMGLTFFVVVCFAIVYLQMGPKVTKPNEPLHPGSFPVVATNDVVTPKPPDVPIKPGGEPVVIVPPTSNDVAKIDKPPHPTPPLRQELLFSPRCRRDSEVMRELESAISMKPDLLRVSLGSCAEIRNMSLDSFKEMARMVIDRLQHTGVRFVMVSDGGKYGNVIQELSRKHSCEIE